MRANVVVLAVLCVAACGAAPSPEPLPDDQTQPADIARPSDGWLRGDLHFHTNYSDDALKQGGDWMREALQIADAWRDEVWTSANPGLSPDDHLQFLAVTDHRTVAGMSDPEFTHPYLVLLGGEEFGSDGHAGIWGSHEHVPHEPQHGETPAERIQAAVAEAHAQGALFSANHPVYSGDLWTWDVSQLDAVEVWNGPWSLMHEETDEATLDAWLVGRNGDENQAIRVAVRSRGGGENAQALRFWQALLSLGYHPAPVGGSDRHMLLPAGLPTTYVAVESESPQGVLDGIASGQTFVSRSPQGPQVRLTAQVDGVAYPMGADLPSSSVEVAIHWRAARAPGGTLTLIEGRVDTSMPDPRVVTTVVVSGSDDEGDFTWSPPVGGGWIHAILTDPLPTPDSPQMQELADELLKPPVAGGGLGVIGALGSMVDIDGMGSPEWCDPRQWAPAKFQCMPADTQPFGTFYIPMALQPWMAIVRQDGESTGDAMGAISAAFVVPAP